MKRIQWINLFKWYTWFNITSCITKTIRQEPFSGERVLELLVSNMFATGFWILILWLFVNKKPLNTFP